LQFGPDAAVAVMVLSWVKEPLPFCCCFTLLVLMRSAVITSFFQKPSLAALGSINEGMQLWLVVLPDAWLLLQMLWWW
jgi:hypothetical protein